MTLTVLSVLQVPLPPLPPVIIPEIEEIEPIPIGEEREEEDLPWWVDALVWVGEEIVDIVLKPAVEGLIELIQWVVEELQYWKKQFFNLLAEIYATDLGFLYLAVATILLTVYTPQILAKIAASGFGTAIKKVGEWVKEKIGNILNLIAIEDILAINDMAKLLWPDWRELMGTLSDVTSALAEELRQGSAYISAWFSTVHAFALLGTSFLDIDPEAAELQAFEDTDKFLKKINENFRHYVHNPGDIVRDIIDELYIPYATDFKDSQQALIGTVGQAQTDIDSTFDLIQAAEDALEHFIGIQPEETAAIVEEKLGPLRDGLADFIYEYKVNVAPVIEGTLQILEDRADIIEERNAILSEKVNDPIYMLGMYELMPSGRQDLFNRAIASMNAEAEANEIQKAKAALDAAADAMIEATKDQYEEAPPVRQPARTALSFEMPGIPLAGAIPGWFVGEY